jgi:hypothetical protein
MTATKLRALFAAGLTYDEIAEANERSEGWKPSRAAVKRKYEAMGMPPRRHSSSDLLPWRIRPEHNSSIFRRMLQAESRARQHQKVSVTDRKLISRLNELLFGRGKLMVVGYSPDIGFMLLEREDADEDIIRAPREHAPVVSDLELTPEALENQGRDAEADGLRLSGPIEVKFLEADPDELPEPEREDAPRTPARPRGRRRAGAR